MKERNSDILQKLLLILLMSLSLFSSVQAQCTDDCVWPGDLNANGIANNLDALAYGIAFGQTGPTRTDANTMWEGQTAEDWGPSLPVLGADYKHVDADGNGVIDINDQFVIAVNYNQTNENFVELLGNNLPGDDLFLVPQNTEVAPSGSLVFDIHLGTEENPISDLYGIGFRIDIDTQYVQEVNFDFSESWVGTDDDYFGFGKFSDEIDHAGVAVTRLDGNTVSGFGKIAQVEIVIIDVVLGLEQDTTTCLPFPIEFKNVLAIDAEEGDLMVRSQGKEMLLKHPSQLTNTNDVRIEDTSLSIFPNPASDILWIESVQEKIESVAIFNQLGQQILQQSFDNTADEIIQINLKNTFISSGFYFVEVISNNTKSVKKVFIKSNL